MSSGEKRTTETTPQLSSVIVRPSASDVGDGDDSRSERRSGESGRKVRAASTSPVRQRDAYRRHNHEFDCSRSREAGSSRSAGRFRGSSPHHGRERGGGRPFRRGPARPDLAGTHRDEPISRSHLSVRPQGGNWYCPDPLHLNFARRDICQACKRPCKASPRRSHPPLPEPFPRRFRIPPPLLDRRFRSPSRVFFKDAPRDFGDDILPLPPRHDDDRFADPYLYRDRSDYLYDHYRVTRFGFERPISLSPPPPPPLDWGHRGFDRRPVSPPPLLLSDHGRWWGRDVGYRSRSPLRGGLPRVHHRRNTYVDQDRDRYAYR